MARTRRTVQSTHGYTVDEVARFLQYDVESVRYWLRTGHLVGQQNPRTGDWSVTATELVSFLRQSVESAPAAAARQSLRSRLSAGASAVVLQSLVPVPAQAPPAVESDRELAHAGRVAS